MSWTEQIIITLIFIWYLWSQQQRTLTAPILFLLLSMTTWVVKKGLGSMLQAIIEHQTQIEDGCRAAACVPMLPDRDQIYVSTAEQSTWKTNWRAADQRYYM